MAQKRFKDFIVDVSQPGNEQLLHDFYSIASQVDYSDDDLRDFFKNTDYAPTRKEYDKIYQLHDNTEVMFDCEYKDY